MRRKHCILTNEKTETVREITRRNFAKMGLSGVGLAMLGASALVCKKDGRDLAPIGTAVKTYAKFSEFSIRSISPNGWLHQFLLNQRDGMTGHLDEIGYPFNTVSWAGEKVMPAKERWSRPDKIEYWGEWWPYEQTGYWIDGMLRCGHLLKDESLVKKSRKYIEYVLEHVAADGVLGPKHVTFRWPHAVFFRAWMAEYSATRDVRLIKALMKHYQATGVEPYQANDDGLSAHNLEEICWLYGITGEQWLLDNAQKIFAGHRGSGRSTHLESLLSDKTPEMHGVCFHEALLLPIILYMYTGEEKLLQAARNGFRKLERDHLLVDGVPSSYEHLSGKDPRMAHETCNVTTFTWTAGYMLLATGEAEWADRIERACFNAGPGSVTKDFKAHQYFSSPNQVVADMTTSYHKLKDYGSTSMAFSPGHFVECCTGNVNRFMPNYAARMWLSDGGAGVVAALYGPCTLKARVGEKGDIVTIVEKTDYPFSEKIAFEIHSKSQVRFSLWLRVPGWCSRASLQINGRPEAIDLVPSTFVKIDRAFSPNDLIELSLPMDLKLTHWPNNGIALERGPLVYSLHIKEDREIVKGVLNTTERFPAYNIRPTSAWNYALAINETNLAPQVEIVQRPVPTNPWQVGDSPIQLLVNARRVKGWELDHGKDPESGLEYRTTPPLPETVDVAGQPLERIMLVPLGCTCIRLTVFPQCQSV